MPTGFHFALSLLIHLFESALPAQSRRGEQARLNPAQRAQQAQRAQPAQLAQPAQPTCI